MIIARIGHTNFIIESLEDANAILRIFSKSKQFDTAYFGDDLEKVMFEPKNPTAVEISIFPDSQILSEKAMRDLRAKYESERGK